MPTESQPKPHLMESHNPTGQKVELNLKVTGPSNHVPQTKLSLFIPINNKAVTIGITIIR